MPRKFQHFKLTPADDALIAALPPNFQKALLDGRRYEQIAEQDGIALGTAKSRVNRARTALQALRDAKT